MALGIRIKIRIRIIVLYETTDDDADYDDGGDGGSGDDAARACVCEKEVCACATKNCAFAVQGIFERAACVPGDDMQITVVFKGRVHPVSHCACFQWGAGPPSPPTLLLRQLASCLAQLVRTVACGVWLQLHACLCSSSLTNMCRRGRALLWRRSLVGKEIAGWLGRFAGPTMQTTLTRVLLHYVVWLEQS